MAWARRAAAGPTPTSTPAAGPGGPVPRRSPAVVYVAITSSPPELVRAAVRALSTLDARVLVASTVHDLPDRDLDGDRLRVGGVLPSHRVMPRVDLAVVAGGQGSVQTALAAGTPVLGLPQQPEQDLARDQQSIRHVATDR